MHFEICNISLKEEIKCITSKVIEKNCINLKEGKKGEFLKKKNTEKDRQVESNVVKMNSHLSVISIN